MKFRRRKKNQFSEKPLGGAWLAPLRSFGRAISGWVEGDDSLHSSRSIGSSVYGVLLFPVRFLGGFLTFMIHAWASSRPGLAFVRAVPAMLFVGLYFMGILVADFVRSESKMLSANMGYYSYHLNPPENHPKYAEWFARKLIEIKPEDDAHKYRLGIAYEQGGKMPQAWDVFMSIAPEEGHGWSDAHVWLGRQYLSSRTDELDESTRTEKAVRHLESAIVADSDNRLAHDTLASYYFQTSDSHPEGSVKANELLELAKQHWLQVIEGDMTPLKIRAIPNLLDVRLRLGEKQARNAARSDINRLMVFAKQYPDVFDLWLVMVRCAVLTEDYPKAIEVVQTGMQTTKSAALKSRISMLGAQVFLKNSDNFKDMTDLPQFRARFKQLCFAVDYNPNEKTAVLKLLDFIRVDKSEPGETGETTGNETVAIGINEAFLYASVTKDSAKSAESVAHALIGMHQISNGNIVDGRNHWRIAMVNKQFKPIHLVINNLIEGAFQYHEDDFSNLLDMITLAIELFPEQPVLYRTRGNYFVSEERYEEAARDFQYVSKQLEDLANAAVATGNEEDLNKKVVRIDLCRQLIDCYEKMGDAEKASDQSVQLEKILDELDIQTRERVKQSLKRLDDEKQQQ